MKEREIFVPHELKTIEIDVEKKIFCVNGEDFGKGCDSFSISCQTGDRDEWFEVHMRVHTDVKYANYNFDGEKTKEGKYQRKEICKA